MRSTYCTRPHWPHSPLSHPTRSVSSLLTLIIVVVCSQHLIAQNASTEATESPTTQSAPVHNTRWNERLNSENETVRLEAIEEIAKQATDSLKMLTAACANSDPFVCDRAVDALAEVANEMPSASDAILEAAKGERTGAMGAMQALSLFGSTALPALEKALRDERLQFSAATGLAELGPAAQAALPTLEQALLADDIHTWHGERVALAMAKAGNAGSELLASHAHNPNMTIRSLVAQGLGASPSPGSTEISAIQSLLLDKITCVRIEAATSAGRLGPTASQTVPQLIEALTDDFRPMRLEAALALGRIGKPALPDLSELLNGDDSDMQILAAIAIGEMATKVPEALPILQAARNSAVDGVRYEAEKALRAIATKNEEEPDNHNNQEGTGAPVKKP